MKMKMKIKTKSNNYLKIQQALWLCLYLVACTAFSGDNPVRLERLSTEEGLSQGTVNSLMLDVDGFLWIATDAGLNRYDGNQIISIKGPDELFTDVATINYVFQDSKGLVWINDINSGLYTLDLVTKQYQKILELASLNIPGQQILVTHIVENEQGDLWLAVDDELLYYHRDSGKVDHVFVLDAPTERLEFIRRLYLHKQHIYIASRIGVYALNTSSGKHKRLVHTPFAKPNDNQNNTKSLYVENNELWVGSVEGLFSLPLNNIEAVINGSAAQGKARLRIAERNIWRIVPTKDKVYLATDQGLFSYVGHNDQLTKLWQFSDDAKFDVTDNDIVDLLFDNTGNMWLASRLNGAFYWNTKTTLFKSYYRKKYGLNQLSTNDVWSVAQSDDGNLWVGTQNGLNKIDPDSNKVFNYLLSDDKKSPSTFATINKIIKGKNGILWLANGDETHNLQKFDTASDKIVPMALANQDAEQVMAQIGRGHYLDEQGQMWFMTDKHFYQFDTDKGTVNALPGLEAVVNPETAAKFLGSLPDRPNTMLLSAGGKLWLVDTRNDSAKQIYGKAGSTGLGGIGPSSWVIDKYNILWLAIAGEGLVGLDAATYEVKYSYDQSNKLSNNSIFGAQLDLFGDLWLSSNDGLMRMNVTTHHVELFTIKDGIASNEFNGGPSSTPSVRLQDGRLVYASMLGAQIFDPADFRKQTAVKNAVKFTQIGLLSRPLDLPLTDLSGTELALNYDDIGLEIHFSNMNFSGQSTSRYRYELSGKKSIQYPESSIASIMIPQLQPGDYDFSVVAINPQNGTESLPQSISISVSHALWASPLAYSLYGLLIFCSTIYWWQRNKRHHQTLLAAHNNLLLSEERLKLALKGSKSGVWDWQIERDMMFEPRINEILSHHRLNNMITLADHVALIHPNDQHDFVEHWKLFLASPDHNFECTYRMKNSLDQWLWFHDLGMLAEKDEQGRPSRITGTYTNITETKANEQQAKLFGEAFKQTRDWVVILDDEQKIIAANQSFRDTFGLGTEQALPSGGKIIGINHQKQRNYLKLLSKLKAGEHWQGEELVVNKDGQTTPVIISINAAAGKSNEVPFFIIVLTDITAQKAAENDLRQLANYDSLTGLPNRALLIDRIKHAIEHAHRYQFKMAVFFIDLDRFKQVNDSLGHDMGDQLLVDVARRLTGVLREGDTVARIGGDEFVILLESYHNIDDVTRIAQKIIVEIDLPIHLSKGTVRVSPSIGIALYPEDAQSQTDLLKNADVAMYHAKQAGRNNYQYFTEKMNEQAKLKLNQETKIKQGFANNEFVNFYQPIVDANNNTVKGFELLLRWQSDGSMISPTEFIPVAEDIGLIVKMTQNAIRQGLIDLRYWYDLGYTPYLSINLSVKDLEKTTFVDDVELLIKVSGLPMSAIRFEITESALMVNVDKAIDTMEKLKKMGAILALDDFGTGYSSLKYLKEFPIDIIKIDRSFVKDIGVDINDEAIIDSILAMANSLGMHCIAEGVETLAQLNFLKNKKCALIQGFLFSKPVAKEHTLALLKGPIDISQQ